MSAKRVVQRVVAAEFGIKQPSVSEWVKHGRIDKSHINHLVAYFSDVVRPSHWGLPDEWGAMPASSTPPAPPQFSAAALRVAAIYDQVSDKDRRYIDAAAAAASPDPTSDAADDGWRDRRDRRDRRHQQAAECGLRRRHCDH